MIRLLLLFLIPALAFIALGVGSPALPILGLIYLGWTGFLCMHFFDNTNKYLAWSVGLITSLALLTSLSGIWYFFIDLTHTSVQIIYGLHTLIIYLFYIVKKSNRTSLLKRPDFKLSFPPLHRPTKGTVLTTLLLIAYIIFVLYIGKNTTAHAFDIATRSLWKMLPYNILVVYIVASILLLALIHRLKLTGRTLLVQIHSLVTLSLAALAYKIGYGFDPFVHLATQQHIAEFGLIMPKPLYYLGQYGLNISLHSLLQLSLNHLNTWLVPCLFAFTLPASLAYFVTEYWDKKHTSGLYVLAALLLPLGLYINTTPQALANMFALLSILFALWLAHPRAPHSLVVPSLMLALATAVIHPIAGIPIIAFGVIVAYFRFLYLKLGRVANIGLLAFVVALLAMSLPSAFLVQNYLSSGMIELPAWPIVYERLQSVTIWNTPSLAHKFNLWGDWAYTLVHNIHVLLLLAATATLVWLRKKSSYVQIFLPLILAYVTTILMYVLTHTLVDFQGVIDYEQASLTGRVRDIAQLFLVPFAAYAIYKVHEYLKSKNSYPRLVALYILLAAIISAQFYTAYPREDGYEYNRGYNVSQADITAVQYINADAQNNDIHNYSVLANQTTSAAALKEYGFKKYYHTSQGELFYYPIPTSSPLYDIYLKMVYDMPSSVIVDQAYELMNTPTVYFVINRYWARSAEIISLAKKQASTWVSLEDGAIYVFRFDKKD